jgi:bacteriorhodopsin
MQFFSNNIPLLFSTIQIYEWVYFGIFVACAVAVYLVLVARIGEDLPRKTVDTIFFLMLGVASLIWVLYKVAGPSSV